MRIAVLTFALLLSVPWLAEASLLAQLEASRHAGQKRVLRFRFKNTLPKKVRSARAQVCLVDEHGKIVARTTRWVIGGALGQPPLEPGQSTLYTFVLEPAGPCSTAQLAFSRIVLEGGETASASPGAWRTDATELGDSQ